MNFKRMIFLSVFIHPCCIISLFKRIFENDILFISCRYQHMSAKVHSVCNVVCFTICLSDFLKKAPKNGLFFT